MFDTKIKPQRVIWFERRKGEDYVEAKIDINCFGVMLHETDGTWDKSFLHFDKEINESIFRSQAQAKRR